MGTPFNIFSVLPYSLPSSAKHFIWMQFTGLLDKNGKEIYEGDILKWNDEVSQVMWRLYDSMFEIEKIFNGFSERVTSDYEIIGNIYENPELLT